VGVFSATIKQMYETIKPLLDEAQRIIIIQAENPDGDSLGSSIALDELLSEQGKDVTMYCPVSLPKYMRYIEGWDRVTDEWSSKHDLAIIVDTSSETLLSKVLDTPGARHFLETHPVIVLDHHASVVSSLPFEHTMIMSDTAVSTSELIYNLAKQAGWTLNKATTDAIYVSIMSDSLGLTTQGTTAESFRVVADLIDAGTVPAELEAKRREMMKKSPEILAYKGKLIERIEYYNEGRVALIHVPWSEIEAYSDQYNPSMLVLDEMRLVEGVEVAVAIKTYPDGKATGKLRSNVPVCDVIAGYFGGGGHPYAAGFRAYESYDVIVKELLQASNKALNERAA
jgi:phosphoesterase RecJ-like protein